MMKEFKNYYDAFAKLQADYEANKDNEAYVEGLRGAYQMIKKEISDRGSDFVQAYELYAGMMKRGNAYIDLGDTSNPYAYDDAEATVAMLRRFGFTQFVFSATWTKMTDEAWGFVQQGCSVIGMVEINGRHKVGWTDEYEKVHGFLFKVN